MIQILNYDRIIEKKVRSLPVIRRTNPDGEGEIVFLRIMDPHDDGTVIFYPSTLELVSGREPPLQAVASRRVELHGWRLAELEGILTRHGIGNFEVLGGFDRTRFEPLESNDLILVASRLEG